MPNPGYPLDFNWSRAHQREASRIDKETSGHFFDFLQPPQAPWDLGARVVGPRAKFTCLLACCLTYPHRGNIARSALAGQGAAAEAAARFALLWQCSPPTTTAIARPRSGLYCRLSTDLLLFAFLCTPVVLTCPWLPEPHSA
jgi:hypothetical protein